MTERAGGRQSSIVDGKLVRTSVSQIRTARDCQVKWAFDKIEHIERKPPGKGVLVGLEGHNQIEHYAKTGEDVRGPIAKAGDFMLDDVRGTMPFMGGGGLVESSLSNPTLFTPGKIEIVGFVDYAAKVAPDLAVIIDHKFTKSVEKYPVTDDDLKEDEQAIVYSTWAAARFKVPRVEFRLNRYQTEGKQVFAAPRVTLTRAEALEKFEVLAHEIDTVLAPLAGLKRAADAKPNTAACGKYGGCDYEKICPHSPRNRWTTDFKPPAAADSAKEEGNAMGLMDSLNKGATPTTPAAVTAAPTALAAKKLTAGDCKAEQEYGLPGGTVGIFKAIAGTNAFFVGKADNAPRMLPIETEVTDPTAVVIAAPVAPAAPAPVLTTTVAGPVSILPPDAPASQPNAVAALATPAAPVAEAVPATDKKKRGPGRPPKEEKTDAPATTAAPVAGGLILLIDCASNQPARDLNAYVAGMARELAKESEVLDIRIAPKKTKEGADHVLAFGGWKAMLSGIALKTVPEGLCSINSSELNDPVIEALSGVASLVIRGGVR